MTAAPADRIQAYLEAHFVTLEALATWAGSRPPRILELIRAGCVPGHSVEVRGDASYVSAQGRVRLPAGPRRYYHPSLLLWIDRAEALAAERPLGEVARAMREAFERETRTALAGRSAPPSLSPGRAWAMVLDGTWGLQLKELSAEAMVERELALAEIASALEADSPGPETCAAFRAAVSRFEAVAATPPPVLEADPGRGLLDQALRRCARGDASSARIEAA